MMPHHIQQNPTGSRDSVPLMELISDRQNNSINGQMINERLNAKLSTRNQYTSLNQLSGNNYEGHASQSFQRENARPYHDFQDTSRPPHIRDFAQHETLLKTPRSESSVNMMYMTDEYNSEHYERSRSKRIINHYQGQRIQRIMSDPHFRQHRNVHQAARQPPIRPLNHSANFNATAGQLAPMQQVPVSSLEPTREQPPHSPKQIDHTSNQTDSLDQDREPRMGPRLDVNDRKDSQSSDQDSVRQVKSSEKRLPPLKKREGRLSKSFTGGEEKTEKNESQEKELVNGALLALVSLAQGPAPAPSCAQKPTRRTSSCASLASIRESHNQTPPPQVDTLVRNTITPSSSVLNIQHPLSNAPNPACIKDNLSSVSDDSNARSDRSFASKRSRSASISEKSIDEHQSTRNLLPKQPLTFPGGPHDLKRSNIPPPFPLPCRSNVPMPRLDIDQVTSSTPGYSLTMRRDAKVYFDRDGIYSDQPRQYMTSDESCVHETRMHETRRPSHGRRPRFYSTPGDYGRQGFHDYDRITEHPQLPHFHERPHPRAYGLEVRGSFDDGRIGGLGSDHLVHQRSRIASRDDYEERGHQYHMTRQHFPEDAYYSPSPHQLPLHKRQPHGPPVFHPPSQSMPRRGHFIQHPPPAHSINSQEVRIQFECPDSRGSRKESSIGPISRVSSYEEYSPNPYQMPVYHNRLPDGHPQGQMGVKKTILRRKCAWKNYPELEKFLIENREEYLLHSAKNYTIEQKQYNNRLTERLLEVAAKHNYMFDPNDFNFVAVRDRIRCYYKSYVQSNKKRGVIVGYNAMGTKKKLKMEDNSDKKCDEEQEQEESENKRFVELKQSNDNGVVGNTADDEKPEKTTTL